jgi:hypothetical protein
MAVLDFVNDISQSIDKGLNNIGIFMDLSKAFDTIDHNILLHKLNHYGFRGVSQQWFANYLSDRKQFVSFNSSKSPEENVKCGVPQGSILGPLLFILYMNDICNTSKLLSLILFADDTTVFYSHEDVATLCKTVNMELSEICNWFKANKLSLNAKKTNLMFFGTRFQTNKLKDAPGIYLDGCKLTRVHSAKFLGITIDENLSWKCQIEQVCKSCSKNIGVLNKIKHFFPKQTMYQLYCTMVLPYLNYGLILWGNANKGYLNKVFRLQKRALRTISNSSYLCSTKPLFDKLKLLNIFEMYTKEVAIFMYRYRNNKLPLSFNGMFSNHFQFHSYDTRNKENFQLQIHKIKTILSTGPVIWNKLPNDIKFAQNSQLFKNKLTSYLRDAK